IRGRGERCFSNFIRPLRPVPQRSVEREMGGDFHFPFSIRDLIFGIARRSPNVQCSLGIESRSPLAMSNIKSLMENGKWFSFAISRFTDGAARYRLARGSGADHLPSFRRLKK